MPIPLSATNGRHGPTWKWLVGVLMGVVSAGLVIAFKLQAKEMDKHDARLDLMERSNGTRDVKIEMQSYRIGADSVILMELRAEVQKANEKLDLLLRGRTR